ncbi:MAG: two-component system, OmpR family, alkaline phosphatase synthesis response regulator PhoP [Actinomycetota bacterium]|jgi:DNA-binding response OmpR family regulator|nr:two-component system, OmpR family, alkaline phosphatase synthesis response regulator PhoP [Actinomycetota bacterium]
MSEGLILVAEDDPSVRLTLEFVLRDEGFEVLCASDGEQALAHAIESQPAIILLDQIMPKMGGKEVLAALRQQDSTKDIPVLVLSGMGRGSANEWPGAEFVGKPFSPEDLVKRIRKTLADGSQTT